MSNYTPRPLRSLGHPNYMYSNFCKKRQIATIFSSNYQVQSILVTYPFVLVVVEINLGQNSTGDSSKKEMAGDVSNEPIQSQPAIPL